MAAMYPLLPEDYAEANKAAARNKLPSKEQRTLKGHEGPVLAVRFNTAGTYCLTCGKVCVFACSADR